MIASTIGQISGAINRRSPLKIIGSIPLPTVISPMSNATAPAPDLEMDEYEVMLDQFDAAVEEIVEKIYNGRIRKPWDEKVRIQYYRTLGYLIRTKRQVLED